MKQKKSRNFIHTALITLLLFVGLGYFRVAPAYSHGGKSHGEEAFTAFQAVQKATQLYDRLIVAGKLSETWETQLKNIKINIRKVSETREYVVQFERASGDPGSVYFFFNKNGEYSGSNFTGK